MFMYEKSLFTVLLFFLVSKTPNQTILLDITFCWCCRYLPRTFGLRSKRREISILQVEIIIFLYFLRKKKLHLSIFYFVWRAKGYLARPTLKLWQQTRSFGEDKNRMKVNQSLQSLGSLPIAVHTFIYKLHLTMF